MKRLAASFILLSLQGCYASPPPSPRSMCELPRSFRTWENTTVRWTGVIVGTHHHGFLLVAEDCWPRGISLDWTDKTHAGAALDEVLAEYAGRWGLVRADVTGRITPDRLLHVTQVHSVEFNQMSEEEVKTYWDSRRM